jgi:hypothetical protein
VQDDLGAVDRRARPEIGNVEHNAFY